MLEHIKEIISMSYSLEEKKGIFFSCFDKKRVLISSHGVIVTNKSLGTVIDMIYHGIIEPKKGEIDYIICDLIENTKLLNTMEDVSNIDITTQGLSISSLDYTKSGILLPDTMGVLGISQALQIIKEKNNIEGNVIIHSFESQKIEIAVQK